MNEGPMTVSGNFANNTGTVANKCTIDIGDDLEIDDALINFGKITADSTSTVNGGGELYLQGGSTLITHALTVYNIIQNDSTDCALLKVTGGTLTEGGGASYVGNVTLCGVDGGSEEASEWNSGTVYTAGMKAVYEGILYEAKWWTQGDQPDLNSGEWDVWINQGTYVAPEPEDSTCGCVPGKVVCDLVVKQLYRATIKQIEVPLYGSDRLGDYRPDLTVDTLVFFSDSLYAVHIERSPRSYLFNDTTSEQLVYRNLGLKEYELRDHMGMRALVRDAKLPLLESGEVKGGLADVRAYFNTYPGGFAHPLRNLNMSDFRYGAYGYEKDDEVKGTANHYSFNDYGYDPRLIRRYQPDPLTMKYPMLSPYHFVNNNPIIYKDFDGRDWGFTVIPATDGGNATLLITLNVYTTMSVDRTAGGIPDPHRNFNRVQTSATVFQDALNNAGLIWTDPATGATYNVQVNVNVMSPEQSKTQGQYNPQTRKTETRQAQATAAADPIGNSFNSLPPETGNADVTGQPRDVRPRSGQYITATPLSSGDDASVLQDIQKLTQLISPNAEDEKIFTDVISEGGNQRAVINQPAAQQFINTSMQSGQANRSAAASGTTTTGNRQPNSVNNSGGIITP